MSHPLSMFHEKGLDDQPYSMTRVVAFIFALTYVAALDGYAFRAKEINWPFAVLGAFVVLAVPLQALFTFLGQWVSSREGRSLLATMTHKIEDLVGNAAAGAAPSVKVSASVGEAK